MKRLLMLWLLLFALIGFGYAQSVCPNQPVNGGYYTPVCPTVTASGTTITIPNVVGTWNASFEELMTGTPATVSVTIQGCMRGNTCDTAADTNTTVAAGAVRAVTFTKLYTYFLVTVTWTGGTSPTVTVNPALSTARSGSGSGFTTAAQVVAAFSGCSGTQYLGADGACHNVGGGVTSWSGDGSLITNSGSTGAVTAAIGSAAAHTFWGNNTGSSAAGAFLRLAIDDLSDGADVAELNSANTHTSGTNDFTAVPILVSTQSASDASTKAASTQYVTTAVSNAVAGVNPAVAVQAATAAVLPNTPTYANGAAGIGATLTAGSNGAITVDGYTPVLLDRLLVKNQASAFQNGVYYFSQIGTGILPYILTRALDYDMPSDMNNTGAIPVVNGTANAQTQWVQTSQVATVGTDAVTFTQFTLNPTTLVTAAANLTSTAIMTGAGSKAAQTPSTTSTLDASGNMSLPGTLAVTGHDTFEGVTSTGATGTGNLVFGTSPTLVTPVLGTPASGTLTNATGLPLNGLVGANAAATLTESAVLRPITFAGVETANLTYPYVFQNTNSTNSNTSGALLANCAGSDGSSTCFMVNSSATPGGLLASFTTGGTVTNGVVSGSPTTEWSITGSGAVTQASSLTLSSGVATVPAGAVGAATYTFAGDTAGSGFYRPGTVTYGITNASNEFMRFSSGGIRATNGAVYGMTASATSSTGSYDTCWHRSAAGVFGFDADSSCSNEAGLLRAGNPCRVTADITLTVNTDITVCTWSLPAVAKAWAWQCKIPWIISAGSGTNTLIIKVNPSQTPTGATTGSAEIKTTNTNTATEATVAVSASGATTLLTSPTITPAAGIFLSSTSGTLLASATAGTFVISYQAAGTTATALAKAGGTCLLY